MESGELKHGDGLHRDGRPVPVTFLCGGDGFPRRWYLPKAQTPGGAVIINNLNPRTFCRCSNPDVIQVAIYPMLLCQRAHVGIALVVQIWRPSKIQSKLALSFGKSQPCQLWHLLPGGSSGATSSRFSSMSSTPAEASRRPRSLPSPLVARSWSPNRTVAL